MVVRLWNYDHQIIYEEKMKRYFYLTLTPEALIASMLPPEDYGNYLAVSTKKRNRGQAVFFEVDENLLGNAFPMERMERKLVPDEKGTPKRSVYLSIYRTLEHVPIEALKSLYLTTDDGRVLEIKQGEFVKQSNDELHLYQQFCPVTPRVASQLEPTKFVSFITDRSQPISVPKIVFVELVLNGLASDPLNASIENLPYSNIDHLRDCLWGLKKSNSKPTKTVFRFFQNDLLFRTIKNGFFVGEGNKILYYPFPTIEELESKYYSWWRSALTVGFRCSVY